jgi:hypothetical protein
VRVFCGVSAGLRVVAGAALRLLGRLVSIPSVASLVPGVVDHRGCPVTNGDSSRGVFGGGWVPSGPKNRNE